MGTFSGEGVLEAELDSKACTAWSVSLQVRPSSTNDSVLLHTMPDDASQAVTIRMSGQNLTLQLASTGEDVTFTALPITENQWNKLTVSAQSSIGVFPSLTVTVNSQVYERNVSNGTVVPFSFAKGAVLLGGAETGHSPTPTLPRFKGCMRNVYIQGKEVLEPLYNALDAHVRDAVQYQIPLLSHSCQQRLLSCSSGEMLLATEGAHLAFNPYAMVSRGRVEFSFEANRENGVILATKGDSDYFYLQLVQGMMCAYVGIQGQNLQLCAGEQLASLGLHKVVFMKHHRRITLEVDGELKEEPIPDTGSHNRFSLDRRILIGTVYSTCFTNRTFVEYSQTDVPLVEGFSGCLRNLKINGMCSSALSDFTCSSRSAPPVPERYKGEKQSTSYCVFACSALWLDVTGMGSRIYMTFFRIDQSSFLLLMCSVPFNTCSFVFFLGCGRIYMCMYCKFNMDEGWFYCVDFETMTWPGIHISASPCVCLTETSPCASVCTCTSPVRLFVCPSLLPQPWPTSKLETFSRLAGTTSATSS